MVLGIEAPLRKWAFGGSKLDGCQVFTLGSMIPHDMLQGLSRLGVAFKELQWIQSW